MCVHIYTKIYRKLYKDREIYIIMSETKKKHILFRNKIKTSLYIDKELWENFKELALKKYGKFHGSLTAEVEMALRSWLNAHTKAHKLDVKNTVNPIPKVFVVYDKVKSYLKKEGIIYQTHVSKLYEAISVVRGNDKRTVRKWMEEFVKWGLIKEISSQIYELK